MIDEETCHEVIYKCTMGYSSMRERESGVSTSMQVQCKMGKIGVEKEHAGETESPKLINQLPTPISL